MGEISGICSICGALAKPAYSCRLCGVLCCTKCFVVKKGVCRNCAGRIGLN